MARALESQTFGHTMLKPDQFFDHLMGIFAADIHKEEMALEDKLARRARDKDKSQGKSDGKGEVVGKSDGKGKVVGKSDGKGKVVGKGKAVILLGDTDAESSSEHTDSLRQNKDKRRNKDKRKDKNKDKEQDIASH